MPDTSNDLNRQARTIQEFVDKAMKEATDSDGSFKSPQDELNAMSAALIRSNVPPAGGGWAIPQAQQSIGLFSGGRYFWLNRDEALTVSRQDARNMLRTLEIRNPLEARMLAVAELPWSIEPQDKKDSRQVAIAKEIQNIIEETPDFLKFRRQLLWAIWFGKSACQCKYRWDYTKGYKRLVVDEWSSVHGDSIVWHYNDKGVAILVGVTGGGTTPGLKQLTTVPTDLAQAHLLDDGAQTEIDEYGRKIQRLTMSEREAFVIHCHNLDPADFFEPELAQSVRGVGLRSVLWWTHYIMTETKGWMSDFMERVGMGFTIYKFLRGNEQSFNAMKILAESQSEQLVMFMPVDLDTQGKMIEGIERIEPSATGLDNLLKVIEYYGSQIRTAIQGQDATSEPVVSGLNSNTADVHEHTFGRLIKYDAINLDETITREFVNVIKKWTYPDEPGKYRFVSACDKPDIKEYLDAVKLFVDMGGRVGEDAVRETIGLPKPDDDEVLLGSGGGGQQPGQAPPGQEGMPGMPGQDEEGEGVDDDQMGELQEALKFAWTSFTGPKGGRGWRNESGSVVYQDDKPSDDEGGGESNDQKKKLGDKIDQLPGRTPLEKEHLKEIASKLSPEQAKQLTSGEAKPAPQPTAPAPLSAEAKALHDTFGKSIDASDLTPEAKTKYKAAFHKAIARMPKKAIKSIEKNVKKMTWHANTESLTKAFFSKEPKMQASKPGAVVYGFYNANDSKIDLDGTAELPKDFGPARANTHEVYVHELSHALDINDDRSGRYSWSPEFKEAFDAEIAGGQISKYAATKPVEAWAEFGRLVYGTQIPLSTIEKRFPKTAGIWKAKGLWPDK